MFVELNWTWVNLLLVIVRNCILSRLKIVDSYCLLKNNFYYKLFEMRRNKNKKTRHWKTMLIVCMCVSFETVDITINGKRCSCVFTVHIANVNYKIKKSFSKKHFHFFSPQLELVLKGALRLKFWWIVKELKRRFEEGKF